VYHDDWRLISQSIMKKLGLSIIVSNRLVLSGVGSIDRPGMFWFSDASEKDSRTEAPSHKKLEDAKKKGQIPKSQDLSAAISLAIMAVLLTVLLTLLYEQSIIMFRNALSNRLYAELAGQASGVLFKSYLSEAALMTAPIALIMMTAGVIGGLFQSQFLITTDPLKPDIKRLNPIQGFKNIFSQKAFVGLIKNLLKLTLVGLVMWNTLISQLDDLMRASQMDTGKLFGLFTGLLGGLLINVAILMVILGGADYFYQRFDFRKSMRMTKQEVKEEYKSLEGDPLVKSFRRQKQKQLAQQRMMQQVPEATVIITNPTHYAVAIRYDDKKDQAPIVIAKGLDFVAENIKRIANQHQIPFVEDKPLAQQLYKQIEVGQEVPAVLYQAMAEVLALIYRENSKRK